MPGEHFHHEDHDPNPRPGPHSNLNAEDYALLRDLDDAQPAVETTAVDTRYDIGGLVFNQLTSHFIDPEATAQVRILDGLPPVDEAYYAQWLADMPPDVKELLDQENAHYWQEKTRHQGTHERLMASVPELYRASLPGELEERLGGHPYAIGFNQTRASHTVEEAVEYLDEDRGIDFTNYGLRQRFLMYDSSDEPSLGFDNPQGIAGAIERGYTNNSANGRFVGAFPQVKQSKYATGKLSTDIPMDPDGTLPDDAIITYEREGVTRQVYSPKYVALFIDGNDRVWKNDNFTISNEPNFVRYQPPDPDLM